jgi:hypothetical protein
MGRKLDHMGRAGLIAMLAGGMLAGMAPSAAVAAGACTSTGAVDRDGTALTARLVNPTGVVRGRVDATGCSVGVYYGAGSRGLVRGAEIFGARYYGVLVDGNTGNVARADVRESTFHDIGDVPITSSRHGQGVAYRAFGDGTATGTVSGSRFWNFQEAGINMTGPGTTATASDNVVRGRGLIDVLSQNGIQIIFGAHGSALRNRISDLEFAGPNTGNGILVAGGAVYDGDPTKGCLPSGCEVTAGARIEGNVILEADTGVVVFNADADVNPPDEPTSTLIARNVIRKSGLTNHAGWDGTIGVQEGVFAYGNRDRIVDNVIGGDGYDQDVCGDAAVCMAIDTVGAIDPIISGNVIR